MNHHKIALLGKGKTGNKLIELMNEKNISYSVFDSTHRPTANNLSGHQVIISFLPGDAFTSYLPLLMETKIPVVVGSTGISWPINFDQQLKALNLSWIYATNFSLGMNLIKPMIEILSKASTLFESYHFNLEETHHTKKLDAPSGTALSMKTWLKNEVEITSLRIDDVIGIHDLKLSTPYEEILLSHRALDRKIFAAGALFAAELILKDKDTNYGFHLFQDVVQKELFK